MHKEVKTFIKQVRKVLPYKFRNRNILEVGSHNINGSIRKYFWFCKWTGIDITAGKNVDIVGNFNEVIIPHKQFQVVVSTEMLEHDKDWQQSLRRMYALLEYGGLMIITCAGPHRAEHGTRRTTPWCSPDTTDYYHNISKKEFYSVLPHDLFKLYVLQYANGENDLQFYGIKQDHHITAKTIYNKLIQNNNENSKRIHSTKIVSAS